MSSGFCKIENVFNIVEKENIIDIVVVSRLPLGRRRSLVDDEISGSHEEKRGKGIECVK